MTLVSPFWCLIPKGEKIKAKTTESTATYEFQKYCVLNLSV
jgi:hypothetical protein